MREELNETGSKLKSEARRTIDDFTGAARESARAQAERQQRMAAGELGTLANALRKTADELQGRSRLPLDRYARQAAERLDDLSANLSGSDIRNLIGKVERYTREQPGVVLGGAAACGFLMARFLRASAEHESRGSAATGSYRSEAGTARRTPGEGLYEGGPAGH